MKNEKLAFNIPTSGKALDFIKIMAALFMIIDHVNTVIFTPLETYQNSMMLIGRAAFPLFCFATACAMHRSNAKSAGNYAVQLLILAIITHPIAYHAHNYAPGNVLFTLAVGASFCHFYPSFSRIIQNLICLCAVYSAFIPVPVEFGFAGILMPVLMFLLMRGDKTSGVWLLIMIYLSNTSGSMDVAYTHPTAFIIKTLYIFMFATLVPFFTIKIAETFPDTGRLLHKYALQIFYPGHLLILSIILWSIKNLLV